MTKNSAFFIIAAIIAAAAQARQGGRIVFSHALQASAANSSAPLRITAGLPDTIAVVAARVDFPPEIPDNPYTTGIGVFDTTSDTTHLDGAPHDSAYFFRHLEFLQNYFDTVSRGKIALRLVMLGGTATLPRTMGYYAPPQSGGGNARLAQFISDAWTAAAAANPLFDFAALDSSRTFFILFHAGVGRDVDLSATYGYNPQPQDLPSMYFDLSALQQALGGSFTGVPVDSGEFRIANTAVVPETETRTVNGSRIVLGTNGLLAAEFGRYLGLPDLYNTAKDFTAIGRFGLEDVASIFAFGGAFPPEPNAWEKAFLGWVQPVELHPSGAQQFALAAPQSAAPSDTTVARMSFNAGEYFLLENRERNPGGGITIHAVVNGAERSYHFASDVYGFNPGDVFSGLSADISALAGTITGCSNYDWAAAGSGVLIWHIDGDIIARYQPDDAINADGHTRGVRLMEADGGVLQIGVPFQTIYGTTVVSEGYDGNAWHRGDQTYFPLYKNEFSDNSQPDARSNSGALSGFRVFDFDTTRAKMTFRAQAGVNGIPLAAGFPQRVDGSPGANAVTVADIDGSGSGAAFLATPNSLLAWKKDGSKVIANNDSFAVFAAEPGIYIAPSIDTVSRKVVALSQHKQGGADSIWLTCWLPQDANNDGRADTAFRRLIAVAAPRALTVPMVVGGKIVFSVDSTIYEYDEEGNVQFTHSGRSSTAFGASLPPVTALAAAGVADDVIVDVGNAAIAELNVSAGRYIWSRDISIGGNTSVSVGDISGGGAMQIAVLSDNGGGVLLDSAGNVAGSFSMKSAGGMLEAAPSGRGILTDATGEGGEELVVGGAYHLFAQNARNASASNFPAPLPGGATYACAVSGMPVSQRNPAPSLTLIPTTDGLLHGIAGNTGKEYPGFPIALGSRVDATPAIADEQLYIAAPDGNLYAYALPFAPNVGWMQYLHDAQHTSFNGAAAAPPQSAQPFFPADRCYNWPNPVRDKFTHIRFYVSQNATVHIRIVNLANELVEKLPDYQAAGGIDNEIELHTDGIQSGVYFVRVEADAGGQSGVNFIKMAIVN